MDAIEAKKYVGDIALDFALDIGHPLTNAADPALSYRRRVHAGNATTLLIESFCKVPKEFDRELVHDMKYFEEEPGGVNAFMVTQNRSETFMILMRMFMDE